MIKVTKSGFIKASAEKIYDYLIQPANLPDYWSNVEVHQIEPLTNGGYRTRWTYKMGGLRFSGTGETIECVVNERIVDEIKGGIESTQTWTLQVEASGTRATFEVEYAVPIPFFGRLIERLVARINDRDGDQLIATLKKRMET